MGGLFSSNNSNNPANPPNNYSNVQNLQINNKTPTESIQRKYESEIFEKIGRGSIYFQRHAVSCANTIEKVFEKGQNLKSKYAANSGISYVGVQQCLQVSDYFSNFRIDTSQTEGGKQPLLIFCCSELTRTHQTLFLSWLKYLKDYKASKGKIIVLPWLNEVAVRKVAGQVFNKDNYPFSLQSEKAIWKKFIENIIGDKEKKIEGNIERIKKDTLNPDSTLEADINGIGNCEFWDELFYLSPIIFKEGGDPFSNSGKVTPIQRDIYHKTKTIGSMKQLLKLFRKIIAKYLIDCQINLQDYDSIVMVMVAHHNSAEHLIKFLMPSTEVKFDEQQLVNCEVVKLPGTCLQSPGEASSNLDMERIFPLPLKQELDIQINRQILKEKELSRSERKIFVNPLFILFMSELNIFLSVNNIVKTRLKAKFTEVISNPQRKFEKNSYESNKRIQVEKPLVRFLSTLTLEEYLKELENAKRYIQKLQEIYKGKPTFYNYTTMIDKINEKIEFLSTYFTKKRFKKNEQQNQKNKSVEEYIENKTKNSKNVTKTKEEIHAAFKTYLFEFCGLDQTAIDSIAVF
jgi:hypothetical protein